MAGKTNSLDFFKALLLVFLITILVFLLKGWDPLNLFNSPQEELEMQNTSSTAPEPLGSSGSVDLPPFPESEITLKLNAQKNELLNDKGVQKFYLDTDNNRWLPVIPDHIRSGLPEDFELIKDESNVWHILESDGVAFATLEKDSLEWVEASVANSELEVMENSTAEADDRLNCPGARSARISGTGATVEVINAMIPLRSSPTAEARNILKSLPIGSRLEIIQLPSCVTYMEGANLWWGVKTEDGIEGFAAEGSAVSDLYYLVENEK